jgi:hypothetical protein
MKTLLATAVLASAMLTWLPDAASAQSCRELRRACEMKDQLGERGEGNCRRFRAQCGGFRDSPRGDRCERLRRACLFKEERGERGEGNCRRFREECGR